MWPYLRARSLGVSPSNDLGCSGAPSSRRILKHSTWALNAAIWRATNPVTGERSCRSACPFLTSEEHTAAWPPSQAAWEQFSEVKCVLSDIFNTVSAQADDKLAGSGLSVVGKERKEKERKEKKRKEKKRKEMKRKAKRKPFLVLDCDALIICEHP